MLTALISFVIFCFIYYGLWSLWCRYAPSMVSQDAPNWIKQPNFFLFFFVTLIFILIYRGASRR